MMVSVSYFWFSAAATIGALVLVAVLLGTGVEVGWDGCIGVAVAEGTARVAADVMITGAAAGSAATLVLGGLKVGARLGAAATFAIGAVAEFATDTVLDSNLTT